MVIRQLTGECEYRVTSVKLASYCAKANQLLEAFRGVRIIHSPRWENRKANAMAQIASGVRFPEGTVTHQVNIQKRHFLLLPFYLRSSFLYHLCNHSSVIDRQTQMDSCWENCDDESRSAADSLTVGSVPQYSATGTRSEESTAAISTHLYEF